MSSFTDQKDPQSVRPETINWAAELGLSSPVDTISTSSWAADGGLTVDSDSKTSTTASCVISAGQLGKYCKLVNTIVTVSAYTYEATITVEIKSA